MIAEWLGACYRRTDNRPDEQPHNGPTPPAANQARRVAAPRYRGVGDLNADRGDQGQQAQADPIGAKPFGARSSEAPMITYMKKPVNTISTMAQDSSEWPRMRVGPASVPDQAQRQRRVPDSNSVNLRKPPPRQPR